MTTPSEFADGQTFPLEVLLKWLESCGVGTKVFRGCRLIKPEQIRIGKYSQIDEAVWIFSGHGVSIGDHVHLAMGSSISGGGRCVIGDFAGIGAGVRLVTGTELVQGDGLTNPTVPTEFRSVERNIVEIGAHVVVFTNSIVFPGVTIGEGAVVAAGSLVHHHLQPWGIYAGHPLVQVGVRPKEAVLRLSQELRKAENSHSEGEPLT